MNDKILYGYTHSGKFHADDVFSSALLKYLYPDIKIRRCKKAPEPSENSIIFDIGMGKFDHHQPDAEVRENGVPYAAFGLLWRHFGKQIVNEHNFLHFDENFVQPLDSNDNTGEKELLAYAVSLFNPVWDSKQSADSAFEQAVDMAYDLLSKIFDKYKAEERAKEQVLKAYKNSTDGVVILDRYMPYKTALDKTDADFVVYPSNRGGYCITNVTKENGEKKFPEQWRGLENSELIRISGIDRLRFCHKSGFLVAAETLESCIKAAEKAVWVERIKNTNK